MKISARCLVGKNVKEKLMLILTRRLKESLVINGNVKLTIVSVDGNQTRIGIDAPKDVQVFREEIYHKAKDFDGNTR